MSMGKNQATLTTTNATPVQVLYDYVEADTAGWYILEYIGSNIANSDFIYGKKLVCAKRVGTGNVAIISQFNLFNEVRTLGALLWGTSATVADSTHIGFAVTGASGATINWLFTSLTSGVDDSYTV